MPLIPFADTNALPEKAKAAFDGLPRKLNIFRMWANAATIFPAGIRYGNAILSKQKLSAARRELVILAVGRIEGGQAQIENGLSPGDRVVTAGHYRVVPGGLVQVLQEKQTAETPADDKVE